MHYSRAPHLFGACSPRCAGGRGAAGPVSRVRERMTACPFRRTHNHWQAFCCRSIRRANARSPAIAARAAPDTEVPFPSWMLLADPPTSVRTFAMHQTTPRTHHLLETAAIIAAAMLQLAAVVLWLQDLR
ncbi:MAG: hypothetical protein NTZ11_07600 [Gammaproteobacteria bacterium]|nr:hypothetical protein [Gammaproteobacteria bacterium]